VSEENDSSDDEKDQKRRPRPEARPEPPASVMKVLTSMGGDGGLLQRVLRSLDKRFQVQDKELAAKFEESQKKIQKLTKEAEVDYTSTIFQINLGQLKLFITETEKLYKAICNKPMDGSLRRQYQGPQKNVAYFIGSLRLPENFVDALAPSV
jgi:hypothetical protein